MLLPFFVVLILPPLPVLQICRYLYNHLIQPLHGSPAEKWKVGTFKTPFLAFQIRKVNSDDISANNTERMLLPWFSYTLPSNLGQCHPLRTSSVA